MSTTNRIGLSQLHYKIHCNPVVQYHNNTLEHSLLFNYYHNGALVYKVVSQSRNTEYNQTIQDHFHKLMTPMVKPSYLHLLMYQLIVVLCWVHLDSAILDIKHQLYNQSPPQLNLTNTPTYLICCHPIKLHTSK